MLGVLTLTALFAGVYGWAARTEIAGAVVAPGRIEVERNRQVVQHPDGGVVETIAVREGDRVARDQLLIRLDGSDLVSERAIVEGKIYELMAREARLDAERDGSEEMTIPSELAAAGRDNAEWSALIDGQRRLFVARRISLEREQGQLRQQQEQIKRQISGIEAQLVSARDQLELLREELTTQKALLAQRLIQTQRVLELRRGEADLVGQRGRLEAARAEAEQRIIELNLATDKLVTQRREQAITTLRDLGYTLLELKERRRTLDARIGRLEIRAPVAGIVLGLKVFAERSVIKSAEPLLYIVPQDRPLVIATQVAPVNIDQVHAGQQAMLRFSAFDSRATPELTGEVVTISADSMQDQRGASFYRAELRLREGELDRLPRGLVLVPGMPVEAFIRTGDRTALQYLVKPLTDYFARAFRGE